MKIGKRIPMPAYVRPEQKAALAKLAKSLGVPQQVVLRQALDDLLKQRGAIVDTADELLTAIRKKKLRMKRK